MGRRSIWFNFEAVPFLICQPVLKRCGATLPTALQRCARADLGVRRQSEATTALWRA